MSEFTVDCFVCGKTLPGDMTVQFLDGEVACFGHKQAEINEARNRKMLVWAVFVDGHNPCICKDIETAADAAGVDGADEEALEVITIRPMLMTRAALAALPEHQGW